MLNERTAMFFFDDALCVCVFVFACVFSQNMYICLVKNLSAAISPFQGGSPPSSQPLSLKNGMHIADKPTVFIFKYAMSSKPY